MALAFVTVIGLIVAGLAAGAQSHLNAYRSANNQRAELYAASGATDIAIEYLRAGPTRGAPGTTCPTVTVPIGPTTATVTCTWTGKINSSDRTLSLTTVVAGTTRIRATIIIRDSTAVNNTPTVDILSWNYLR